MLIALLICLAMPLALYGIMKLQDADLKRKDKE